ncbi:hypothetical protein CFC21_111552, partial [Triticum aestivum]
GAAVDSEAPAIRARHRLRPLAAPRRHDQPLALLPRRPADAREAAPGRIRRPLSRCYRRRLPNLWARVYSRTAEAAGSTPLPVIVYFRGLHARGRHVPSLLPRAGLRRRLRQLPPRARAPLPGRLRGLRGRAPLPRIQLHRPPCRRHLRPGGRPFALL